MTYREKERVGKGETRGKEEIDGRQATGGGRRRTTGDDRWVEDIGRKTRTRGGGAVNKRRKGREKKTGARGTRCGRAAEGEARGEKAGTRNAGVRYEGQAGLLLTRTLRPPRRRARKGKERGTHKKIGGLATKRALELVVGYQIKIKVRLYTWICASVLPEIV
jgi:hypothetical protein